LASTPVGLTKEELMEAYVIANADMWAETYLMNPTFPDKPLTLRQYQRRILQDEHYRNLLRMGRRCVAKGDLIYTQKGPLPVEELLLRQKELDIYTVDPETYTLKRTSDYEVWYNDKVPTIQITTKSGKKQRVSVDHPFLVYAESGPSWVEAQDIKPGMRVGVPRQITQSYGNTFTEDEAYLLGYLVGDGGLSDIDKTGVRFTCADEESKLELAEICSRLGMNLVKYHNKYAYGITDGYTGHSSKPRELVRKAGLSGTTSHTKVVPPGIFMSTLESIQAFIAGYWMTDGWVTEKSKPSDSLHPNKQPTVGVSSVSKPLLEGIRYLLLLFGIQSSMRKKVTQCNGKSFTSYSLTIGDKQSLERFFDSVPLSSYKGRNTKTISLGNGDRGKSWHTQAPLESTLQLVGVCNENDYSIRALTKDHIKLRKDRAQATWKNLEIAKAIGHRQTVNALENDLLWEPIESIEMLSDPIDTYDLHVPETECFVGNGIVQHNTGKSVVLSIRALHRSFTNNNRQVLLTAAYESQLMNLFDLIRRMAFDSPHLKNSIAAFRKKPFELWWKNNSVVRGMVANSSIRGQCLIRGTKVWMADADSPEWKSIEDIRPGEHVFTVDPKLYGPVAAEVTDKIDNGIQDTFELRTTSARRLIATGNHPLYVFGEGWKELKDIKTYEKNKSDADFIVVSDVLGNPFWSRVRSIKPHGKAATFDISVKDYHHFVAFYPNEVEETGFKVSGWSNGGILVHNSADDLIVDEADYIPEAILLADVWPIATTYKHTTVTLSSTPTGRRLFFWKVSTYKDEPEFNFREFHVESSDSPEWTPEQEAFVKATTTKEQYEHEYRAMFGEAVDGVFRHKDIDQCMFVYDYKDLKYNPNNYYTLGVDWNEPKNGVQIVIMEYLNDPVEMIPYNGGRWRDENGDPLEPVWVKNRLRLFRHYSIDALDYINTQAVDEILKVMQLDPVNWCMFDHGHGQTNWELLRLAISKGQSATGRKVIGLKHMLDNMDVLDFGSTITTEDPRETNKEQKHNAKNFIVELLNSLLMNNMLCIPAMDLSGNAVEDQERGLVHQMRDYNIKRIGTKGAIYEAGSSGDHTLDATMLAAYAYGKEHAEFLKFDFVTKPQETTNTILPQIISNRFMGQQQQSVPGYTMNAQGILVRDIGNWSGKGEPPDADDRPTGIAPSVPHTRRADRLTRRGSRAL